MEVVAEEENRKNKKKKKMVKSTKVGSSMYIEEIEEKIKVYFQSQSDSLPASEIFSYRIFVLVIIAVAIIQSP